MRKDVWAKRKKRLRLKKASLEEKKKRGTVKKKVELFGDVVRFYICGRSFINS